MIKLVEAICSGEKWYPQSVDKYKEAVIINGAYHDIACLRSNFAYSMQYIEYLEKQIEEFKLSEVLSKMTYKSYIINAMSIIEMLFSYIIRSTNNWPTSELIELKRFKANPKILYKEQVVIETIIYHKTDKYDKRLDFDSMIKKVETKGLLSINHDVFPLLKHLRQLRNKVHIQQGDSSTDHDYNNFNSNELMKTRKVLYDVLISSELCKIPGIYRFLKVKID